MVFAVVSDSHGNSEGIDKIFKQYEFDDFIFLGDGIDDLGSYKYLPNVHIVRGNCDFLSTYPAVEVLRIDDMCILATHGHKYGVKHTLSILASECKKEGAELALFGHTHQLCDIYHDGVRMVNPGSLKAGGDNTPTFVLLDVGDDKIKIKHIIL